jgi:hypothetical protein
MEMVGAWVVDFFDARDADKIAKQRMGVAIENVLYWSYRVLTRSALFESVRTFPQYAGHFPPDYNKPPYSEPLPELPPEWYTKLLALEERMKSR